MRIIAHNIRSLHNVGSVFRSADAFGVERIYLTGYTATPPRKEIAKTALGSEDQVAWEFHADVLPFITQLKKDGFTVLALENASGTEPILEVAKRLDPTRVVLLLGSEVEGVDKDVLAACDGAVEIPMPGRKRSLNVSVATGIALFAFSGK